VAAAAAVVVVLSVIYDRQLCIPLGSSSAMSLLFVVQLCVVTGNGLYFEIIESMCVVCK
jgi:hypothetical protein